MDEVFQTQLYFYSALFQGNAAIISILAVFLTFYWQSVEKQIETIDDNGNEIFRTLIVDNNSEWFQLFSEFNVDSYNSFKSKYEEMKEKVEQLSLIERKLIEKNISEFGLNDLYKKNISLVKLQDTIWGKFKTLFFWFSLIIFISLIFLSFSNCFSINHTVAYSLLVLFSLFNAILLFGSFKFIQTSLYRQNP